MGETAIALAQSGFDVSGVEESQNASDFLKSHYPGVVHWICSDISNFLNNNECFDVLTLFHVLEHIPHPLQFAALCRDSLNPGGYLIIEAPDVSGGLAKLKGKKWEYWLPHHVNYFGVKSLRRLFEPLGMRLIKSKKLYHFGYPQGILWKDIIHGGLAFIGINSIIRTCFRLDSTG